MKKKIAILGTFDVENYGDLLFPTIAKYRLGHNFEIVPVSPTSKKVWGMPPVLDFPTFLREIKTFSGILIGGGNIIHPYSWIYTHCKMAYPALWLYSTVAAVMEGIPVCWNAPGVPSTLLHSDRYPLIHWALAHANYISVRDKPSIAHLPNVGVRERHVVPDTASEICKVFADKSTFDQIADEFQLSANAYIVYHVNHRYLKDGIVGTAAVINAISTKTNTHIILLPLGPCHGDVELAQKISHHIDVAHHVYRPQSTKHVASLIANCRACFGSSMHGFITACSFRRPAAIVASPESDMNKFHGFVEQCDENPEKYLFKSWKKLQANLDEILSQKSLPDISHDALDQHWDAIEKCFLEGTAPPRDTTELESWLNVGHNDEAHRLIAFELRNLLEVSSNK